MQVGPAAFCLHLQHHTPACGTPRQSAKAISRAGQGPGLQVFPGSIPDVDCVSTRSDYLHYVRYRNFIHACKTCGCGCTALPGIMW